MKLYPLKTERSCNSLTRSKGNHHMKHLLFKYFRVLYCIQISGQNSMSIPNRNTHKIRIASCTERTSVLYLLYLITSVSRPRVDTRLVLWVYLILPLFQCSNVHWTFKLRWREKRGNRLLLLRQVLVFEGHCCAWQYESFSFECSFRFLMSLNFIHAKRPINLRMEGQRHLFLLWKGWVGKEESKETM